MPGADFQRGETYFTEPIQTADLDKIIISSELMARPMRQANYVAETAAIQSIAELLGRGNPAIFKGLARLGVELCAAGSAGVSVIENGTSGNRVFRWQALAGVVEPYEGGDTPRNWSPCGSCLDAGKPMLYSYPERHFTYLQALGVPIVEGLVIPMFAYGPEGATIWIASHDQTRRFDAEDVRIMTVLGAFATRSLSLEARAGEAIHDDGLGVADRAWGTYIRQSALGDQSGLAALFKETSPLVFAAALRIVGFRADADEVTADVYARVWKVAHSYDARRGSAASWLRAITRRLAFDHLRSSALKTRYEKELSGDFRGIADIEGDLIGGQTRESVFAALRALPGEQGEAIRLAYFSGLTVPQIAHQTGEPAGTIKTRIRLGLIKLRRLLAAGA